MAPIADFLAGLTRRQRFTLAALTGGAFVWHLALPDYLGGAVYIEGPLPAIAGAAVGLRLTRDDDLPMQILGACAAAFLGELAAVVVIGLAVYGPFSMLAGVFGLARSAFRLPSSTLSASWGTHYALWGLWASIKPLLAWGAAGFAVLLYQRHGQAWLTVLLRSLGDRRVVAGDRRQRLKEYYRDYAAAVRRGEAPPPPPVGLPAPGTTDVTRYAQLSFWGLRIGLLLAGAFGIYATFGDALAGGLTSIFWRGLFGG